MAASLRLRELIGEQAGVRCREDPAPCSEVEVHVAGHADGPAGDSEASGVEGLRHQVPVSDSQQPSLDELRAAVGGDHPLRFPSVQGRDIDPRILGPRIGVIGGEIEDVLSVR